MTDEELTFIARAVAPYRIEDPLGDPMPLVAYGGHCCNLDALRIALREAQARALEKVAQEADDFADEIEPDDLRETAVRIRLGKVSL